MPERELLVRIVGDDRDLQRAFKSSEKGAVAFESRFTRLNKTLRGGLSGFGGGSSLLFGSGAFISTAAITAGLAKSVKAASDLNEQLTKSRQIFGDASQEIEDWSTTTARSIGVARVAALEATGTFGNLFSTVGLGQAAAGDMSQALVQLAADLASFNNARIDDVLVAIRSGLIGEAEPLRRYGVLLSETRVAQEAMAATGKENVKELTNQEKALARYNIILQDTLPAQGDFARTSEGLANQSRILRAELNDLAANLGGKVVPALTTATRAANEFFDLIRDPGGGGDVEINIEDVDLAGLVALRDRLREIKGEGDDVVRILDEIVSKVRAIQVPPRPDDIGSARGPGAVAASNRLVEAKNAEEAAKKARADLEASRKRFRETVLGLGLKLDKSQLTGSLNDDIRALQELEAAIIRQIQREGKTFKLVEALTDTRLQIASRLEQRASEAAGAAANAFEATMDALSLDLEMAQTTKSLADDQAALRAIEQALLERIRQEGQTTELLRELLRVRQEQQDVARQIAENTRQRRQERQFEALGLTAEGEELVPGRRALSRRAASLEEQIKGTTLDTEKTRQKLEHIRDVLAGKFGEVGRDVRQAILDMLNQISGALKEGSENVESGVNTAFQKTGANKLLEGLGLSEEEIKALRQRLAQIGPGGSVPGKGIGAFGLTITSGAGTVAVGDPRSRQSIVIENHLFLDSKEIAFSTTKRQQKKRGRNAPSRRGVRPGM